MPINTTDPTVFGTTVLIGDTGFGGSPPILTEVSGIPIAAALEVQSELGAFVLPRMTDPEMQALFPVVDGMIVYNSTHTAPYSHQGGNWAPLGSGGSGSVTSITQGANIVLTPSPISTTGSVALNTTLTGLISATIDVVTISNAGIVSTSPSFRITASAAISDLNLTSSSNIFLNTGTAGSGTIGVTNGSRLALYNNATSAFVALRASPTLASSASYILPSTIPSINGQVLSSDTSGNMSWITSGTGTVTSITAGSNLTGGTITTNGTIALSNAISGLTSISSGNVTMNTNGISSTALLNLNSSANISIASNAGGNNTTIILSNTSWSVNQPLNLLPRFGTTANQIFFYNGAGTGVTSISANQTQPATSIAYTFPTTAPASNGQVLSATTAGAMSWVNQSSGSGTVTSIAPGASGNITMSPNPITTTGTVDLNSTLSGITQANIGGFVYDNFGINIPTGGPVSTININSNPGAGGIIRTIGPLFVDASSTFNTTQGLRLTNGQPPSSATYNALYTSNSQASNISYVWPLTAPTGTQVLSGVVSGSFVNMSWANAGSGTVTSITASGPNLTGGTITSTGTIGLNPVLAGLTSAQIGGSNYTNTGISSAVNYIISSSTSNLSFVPAAGFSNQSFGPLDVVPLSGAAYPLRMWDNAGTNYVSLISPATLSQNYSYILPNAYPAAANATLISGTSGTMAWTSQIYDTSNAGTNSLFYGSLSGSLSVTGNFNTAVGIRSLANITSGGFNTSLGNSSGISLSTGSNNTLIGLSSGAALTSGSDNTGCGASTLINCTGSQNSVFGSLAMHDATTCSNNSLFGFRVLHYITTSASLNTAVGNQIGDNASIVSCNTSSYFGANGGPSVNNLTNSGTFGYNTSIAVSNAINLGNACNIGISQPSPAYTLHMAAISGSCTIFLANSTTPATPTGGGILFVASGALNYIGSSGTITVIAPA
jgi:hypothetical protein